MAAIKYGQIGSRLLPVCVALSVLSGCSGGDGSTPTPPPPPANTAPSFTSATSVSIPEGQTAPLYTAVATDAQGTAITYSISGGADAARFTINPSTGSIIFRTAPDFETPADADGDNVYVLQLSASDGALTSATLFLSVTVTDDRGGPVRARFVASGFNDARQMNAIPDGSGRLFVLERGGLIRILTPASGAIAAVAFLDISGDVSISIERGLQGFALAPDFASSGIFYIAFFNRSNAVEVRRYRTQTGDRDRADVATADTIMLLPHPATSFVGTWIGFDRAGMLFVANPIGGGQPLDGKLLRIDPSGDAFPGDADRDYMIPADNPNPTGSAPEVWISDIRSVFGGSVDLQTNSLWIADRPNRGTAYYRIASSDKGKTATPGAFCSVTDGMLPQPADTIRVFRDYTFCIGPLGDNGSVGGHVYRGTVEALQGNYFVGYNFGSAGIRSYNLAAGTIRGYPELGAAANSINGWGEDQNRNLYFVNSAGAVYILESA